MDHHLLILRFRKQDEKCRVALEVEKGFRHLIQVLDLLHHNTSLSPLLISQVLNFHDQNKVCALS